MRVLKYIFFMKDGIFINTTFKFVIIKTIIRHYCKLRITHVAPRRNVLRVKLAGLLYL